MTLAASPDDVYVEVTVLTDRVDLFASATGVAVHDLVRWNLAYFHRRPWLWLGVGDRLRVAPPVGGGGRELVVDDRLLVVDDDVLTVEVTQT